MKCAQKLPGQWGVSGIQISISKTTFAHCEAATTCCRVLGDLGFKLHLWTSSFIQRLINFCSGHGGAASQVRLCTAVNLKMVITITADKETQQILTARTINIAHQHVYQFINSWLMDLARAGLLWKFTESSSSLSHQVSKSMTGSSPKTNTKAVNCSSVYRHCWQLKFPAEYLLLSW